MIFVTFPLMLCALVPVILVEAWVGRPLLQIGFSRSTWVFAIANVVSTVVGVPAAWVATFALEFIFWTTFGRVIPDKGWEGPVGMVISTIMGPAWLGPSDAYWAVPLAAMVLLVPSFFASWYIEAFVLDQMLDSEWSVVRDTSFKANLASYTLLFAGGCVWLAIALVRNR